ncbi:MAG TPA: hypothetical protein VLE20_11900, partial [Blastocatellia bacterium]|nr:hypothetical protein [Blastocatellia bacterium]
MLESFEKAPVEVERFRRSALIVGVAGLLMCTLPAVLVASLRDQFFRSYLLSFVFWIGITLGCFAILMVQHMSGGAWGLVIRRVLESATRTFPLFALLFVPIILGAHSLYIWARPDEVAASEALRHKSAYLNITFFVIRAGFYFVVWFTVSRALNKWSLEQDKTGERGLTSKMQNLCGPGLVLYGLTVTFASIDWVMSLQPEWFSTIFGILFMGGQGLSAMAFVIAVIVLLASRKPMSEVIQPGHLQDLGKLMLAFLMLWAYFAFSQFLIIWSGNLPEETPWYVRRLQSSWKYVGLALVLVHFALPFVLLLSRDLKRNARRLVIVAGLVIVMRFVDLIWMIVPEVRGGGFAVHWMDVVMSFG